VALDTMTAEVWTAELLSNLRKSYIYGQAGVINRNYQGAIAARGDTVHITTIGPVTIVTYTKNGALPAPETLNSTDQTLQITESKAFNFEVDDIDQAQIGTAPMTGGMAEAANGLVDVADQFLATTMTNGAIAGGNSIGTAAAPQAVSPATVYDLLVDLGVLLTDDKVPTTGRFAVVTPRFHGQLAKSDEFTKASDLGDTTVVNGRVGRAAGFDILVSHNVPRLGTGAAGDLFRKAIVGGSAIATTYAEQINKVEGYRPEGSFSDAVKGLHLYGAKVTRPTALAVIQAADADA
jgi:hypothetical protein